MTLADKLRALAKNGYSDNMMTGDIVDRLLALAGRVEAVEKDAARYRWLRGKFCVAPDAVARIGIAFDVDPPSVSAQSDNEQIDAAIDAAIKEQADAT